MAATAEAVRRRHLVCKLNMSARKCNQRETYEFFAICAATDAAMKQFEQTPPAETKEPGAKEPIPDYQI